MERTPSLLKNGPATARTTLDELSLRDLKEFAGVREAETANRAPRRESRLLGRSVPGRLDKKTVARVAGGGRGI